MRIAVDPKVLGAQEWLAPLGELMPVMGRATDPSELTSADALVIRSVTRVNEALMHNCPASFVGTTTIGFDHIDRDFLAGRATVWTNAPGCNAPAVADYVESCLAHHCRDIDKTPAQLTAGVIGVGGIGRIVAQRLQQLGFQVRLNDPVRHQAGDLDEHCELDSLIDQCDVITVHVPLIREGQYPTLNLLNDQQFQRMGSHQLLISAGRGAALNNPALARRLQQPNPPKVALDVWKDEPNILPELWPLAWMATPHIAGHALEGKLRGTWMIAQHLADHIQRPFSGPTVSQLASQMHPRPDTQSMDWQTRALAVYDPRQDDIRFRAALAGKTGVDLAQAFDMLRDTYPPRREIYPEETP